MMVPSSAKDAAPAHERRPEKSHTARAIAGEGTFVSTSPGDEKMPEPIWTLTKMASACLTDKWRCDEIAWWSLGEIAEPETIAGYATGQFDV